MCTIMWYAAETNIYSIFVATRYSKWHIAHYLFCFFYLVHFSLTQLAFDLLCSTRPGTTTMSSSSMNADEMMGQIQAQVNAQMGEVFREQVTNKCFQVCADVSKKQMSSRESDCVDRCLNRFIDAMNVVTQALATRSNRM